MSKKSEDFKEYMLSKSGLFTSLGVFIALMIWTTDINLISIGGFFISFVIISYLLREININDTWGWLLYLGYNFLFIGMFIYGIKSISSGVRWLDTVVIVILVLFYSYVTITKFFQAIRVTK